MYVSRLRLVKISRATTLALLLLGGSPLLIPAQATQSLRDSCAGYLTHPCGFLPSAWSISSRPGIMLADPKTYLESTAV
jgi:hypothetical protein